VSSISDVPTAPESAATVPSILLVGLAPVWNGESSLLVNVVERTNVTGSKAFACMILNGEYEQALAVARQQVGNGAQIIDPNIFAIATGIEEHNNGAVNFMEAMR
jgi:cobalamin-dependent methionine synthase I